jgi:predicted CopG family antitoxin
MPVKTTIVLKDEVYEYLIKKFGKRKISEAINQALMKQFFKPFKTF